MSIVRLIRLKVFLKFTEKVMSIFSKNFSEKKPYTCHEPLPFYLCPFCNYTTTHGITHQIFTHLCRFNGVHNEGIFKRCDQCNVGSFSTIWYYFHEKNCARKTSLKKTIIFENNKENEHRDLLQCDQCNYQTPLKKKLENHTKEKHIISIDTQKWFKCDYCEFNSQIINELRAHNIEEHGLKLYYCDQCDFKTKYRTSFIRHNLKHISVESKNCFQCDQCDYKTMMDCYLKSHKTRVHSPNRLKKYFTCEHCLLKLTSKYVLMNHIKIKHSLITSQDWYECDQCEFKTITKYYLNKHKRIHTPLEVRQRFQCDQCDFTTLYKYRVKAHKIQNHGS